MTERSRGRGPTLAKDINRKIVYRFVKKCRQTSRADAARQLGLNKNTVNTIVDELAAAGFIRDLGEQATSAVGRKPILIGFHAGNKWALGIHVASTVLHWAVTDLYAAPMESFSTALPAGDPGTVAAEIVAGWARLTAKYDVRDCIGVCLGVPGLIDPTHTAVVNSSHLAWEQVPIADMLLDGLGRRIGLDNSVKLASLGELWHGRGQGAANFVYANFGYGVGSGLIVGGSLVRGASNSAGELGHLVVDPDGPRCGCGNRGCLEAFVGLPALLRRAGAGSSSGAGMEPADAVSGAGTDTSEHPGTTADAGTRFVGAGDPATETRSVACGDSGTSLSLQELLDGLAAGNERYTRELERSGRLIGRALSYAANLLNPELVVLDGPLMLAAPWLLPAIEEEFRRHSLPVNAERAALTVSGLYPSAVCIGAAAQVIQTWEEEIDPLELVTL